MRTLLPCGWCRPISSSMSATGWEGNTRTLESQTGVGWEGEHCSWGQGAWEESDGAWTQTGKPRGPDGDDQSLAFMCTTSAQEHCRREQRCAAGPGERLCGKVAWEVAFGAGLPGFNPLLLWQLG